MGDEGHVYGCMGVESQPSRVALSPKSCLQPPPPTTSSVAEPLESEHTDSDDDNAQPARGGSQTTETPTQPPNQQQRLAVRPAVRPAVPSYGASSES